MTNAVDAGVERLAKLMRKQFPASTWMPAYWNLTKILAADPGLKALYQYVENDRGCSDADAALKIWETGK